MNSKHKMLAIMALVGVLGIPMLSHMAAAQPDVTNIVSRGIAVSTNSTAITFIRIGIHEGNTTTGNLKFGNQLFTLQNITVSNGSITANVYNNSTASGSLSLQSSTSGPKILWTGNLSLNGLIYNSYMIQIANHFGLNRFCDHHPRICAITHPRLLNR